MIKDEIEKAKKTIQRLEQIQNEIEDICKNSIVLLPKHEINAAIEDAIFYEARQLKHLLYDQLMGKE